LLRLAAESTIKDRGFAPNLIELGLELDQEMVEVLAGFFDRLWFAKFGQHQQQDDGTESTANDVEKRQ
jgi:hypothetical protein